MPKDEAVEVTPYVMYDDPSQPTPGMRDFGPHVERVDEDADRKQAQQSRPYGGETAPDSPQAPPEPPDPQEGDKEPVDDPEDAPESPTTEPEGSPEPEPATPPDPTPATPASSGKKKKG